MLLAVRAWLHIVSIRRLFIFPVHWSKTIWREGGREREGGEDEREGGEGGRREGGEREGVSLCIAMRRNIIV